MVSHQLQTPAPIFGLFPGQGSQEPGMAAEWLHQSLEVRQTFEECSDALSINLKKLCLSASADELRKTENAQPALLTTSIAIWRAIHSRLPLPMTSLLGHSLGEYSALVATGCLSGFHAAQIVRARGEYMQSAVPQGVGGMCALLGPTFEEAKATLQQFVADQSQKGPWDRILTPANVNAPGQTVLAGHLEAIEQLRSWAADEPSLKGKRFKIIPLDVSAPFHCSLMSPAQKLLSKLFATTHSQSFRLELTTPIYPNVTARRLTEPSAIRELLIEQVTAPVLFQPSLETALKDAQLSDSGAAFLEFGHGDVLSGLTKRIVAPMGIPVKLFQSSTPSVLGEIETWLNQAKPTA